MTAEPGNTEHGRRRAWLIAGALVGLGAAGWAMFALTRPAAVETLRPKMVFVPEVVQVEGIAVGPKEVELTLHTPGILVQVLVTPGSKVAAEQVIVRLASQSGARDLERAEAVVKDARAELEGVRRALEREAGALEELRAAQPAAPVSGLAQAREEVGKLREEVARLAREAGDSREAERELKTAAQEMESARARVDIERAHAERMAALRARTLQLMTEGKASASDVAEAQVDLNKAKRKLDEANRALEETRERWSGIRGRANPGSLERFEKARRALDDAEKRYAALARDQRGDSAGETETVADTRSAALRERLRAALERLERAEDTRDQIDASLRITDARAPFDGVVTEVLRAEGDVVSAESVVLSIVESKPPVAQMKVPAAEAARIRLGQKAQVALRSAPEATFEASVTEIPEAADAQGTVTVKLELAADPDAVSGRKPAVGEVTVDPNRVLPTVAEACLVRVGEEAWVMVVERGRIARRQVTPGPVTPEGTAILEGLTASDLVALAPLQVKEGSRARAVEVKTASTAEAGEKAAE